MRRLLFGVLSGLACATTTPTHPPPSGLEPYAASIDWERAGAEAIRVLSEYLRVDTFNPPGNEARGAQFLAEVLAKDGIESTVSEFAPGRSNVVARLKATGSPKRKPLCLLSHIDVVPAEASEWPAEKGPLSGAIDENGMLWGRGALDMKGMGALELMTLVWLKRAQVPLERDVILIAVGDEEVDSQGLKHLLATSWSQLDCGQVVNEGGLGVQGLIFEGQTVFAISVAEKGALWLRITVSGEPGHGSLPDTTRSPTRLTEVLRRLGARTPEARVDVSLYELLRRVGEHRGGVGGAVLQSPFLVDLLVKGRLMAKRTTRAAMTTTCQVTGFEGKGSSPNVVPSHVAAIVDCRLLPEVTPEALLAELKEQLAGIEGLSFEVLNADVANRSSWDDDFFEALARRLTAGRSEAVAGPVLSPGYTDSLLLRPKGAAAFGIIPFSVSQEELSTLHGKHERVSVSNIRRGLEVLFRAVVDVSAATLAKSNHQQVPP
jgi:acetylornithine deacetylase/succinyl-diaminopimelate desuccinylase-like protein